MGNTQDADDDTASTVDISTDNTTDNATGTIHNIVDNTVHAVKGAASATNGIVKKAVNNMNSALKTAQSAVNQELHRIADNPLISRSKIYQLAKKVYKQQRSPVLIDPKHVLNRISSKISHYKHSTLPLTILLNQPFNTFNKNTFKQKLSSKMNISYQKLNIISVTNGSVIVKMNIDDIKFADEIRTDDTRRNFVEIFDAFAIEIGEIKQDVNNIGASYYLKQSKHILSTNIPLRIGYFIEPGVEQTWKNAFLRAIKLVNNACPGIDITQDPQKKKIIIQSNAEKQACCKQNIILHNRATIGFGSEWPLNNRNGSALHVLLHALGFQHEHNRDDIDIDDVKSVDVEDINDILKSNKLEHESDDVYLGITKYDPSSIMCYQNCDGKWNSDVDKEEYVTEYFCNSAINGKPDVLSALDEIGLNLVYKPVVRASYNPKLTRINSKTSLYYCGRMNVNCNDMMSNQCGPNSGANCTACRVLKHDDFPKGNDTEYQVWQGSSGNFYCGKKMQKKGISNDKEYFCGPDNGIACVSCTSLLNP